MDHALTVAVLMPNRSLITIDGSVAAASSMAVSRAGAGPLPEASLGRPGSVGKTSFLIPVAWCDSGLACQEGVTCGGDHLQPRQLP